MSLLVDLLKRSSRFFSSRESCSSHIAPSYARHFLRVRRPLVALLAGLVLFPFLFTPLLYAQTPENGEEGAREEKLPDPPSEAQDERRVLEEQLVSLEKAVKEHEQTIEHYKKQGKTLNNEIGALNAKIAKVNLQIKAVNVTLNKLNHEVNETQRQINRTENKIESHKEALSHAMQEIYESSREGAFEIMLAHDRFSDFFGSLNNIVFMQSNVRNTLEEVAKLREELLATKQELVLEKEDAENLRAIQQAQKRNVEGAQSEKQYLLRTTKGKETEYQKLLAKTKETAAQIRTRIFELLGGGELTFEKAYDYARLAEGATGVRAALILAVLHRESLLGKNVGRCNYKKAMNPKDIPVFLNIVGKLNMDPDSTIAQVSCPNNDGVYGGAMGPAQFIPSTWRLYEKDIARVTGSNPPSPWNNSDAFVATGLYLQKFGANSKSVAAEKRAAPRVVQIF